MQTFIQLAIGFAPLALVSLFFLIRKKIRILPVLALVGCVGIVAYFGVTEMNDSSNQKKKTVKMLASTDDYIHLSTSDMINGNLERAEKFLREMYSKNGESAQGTLANARLQAFKGDFAGARALYEKLKSVGGEDLLDKADEELIEAIDDGSAYNLIDATNILDEINMLEEVPDNDLYLGAEELGEDYDLEDISDDSSDSADDTSDYTSDDESSKDDKAPAKDDSSDDTSDDEGSKDDTSDATSDDTSDDKSSKDDTSSTKDKTKDTTKDKKSTKTKKKSVDITAYGYSADQKEKVKKIVDRSYNPVEGITAAMKKEVEKREEDDKHYQKLCEAVDVCDELNSKYEEYIKGGKVDEDEIKDAVDELHEVYEDYPEIFGVESIDESYVKGMVMNEDKKELADYADETGSQIGLVTVGQLVIDEEIRDKDFPKDFVSISKENVKEVTAQCKEALDTIKKDEDPSGAELMEIEEKVDAVEGMADNLSLTELSMRVDPELVNEKMESQIHFGKSVMCYALGNVQMGDEEFGASIEMAPYAGIDAYSQAFEGVSQVLYDVVDDNEVKNIGDFIEQAYDLGIPHISEETADISSTSSSDDGNEEKKSAKEMITAQGTTYVSKQKAVTNIGKIDISQFPKVSFNLQTAKPLDLKNPGLILNDCNINITDYTVTKNEFNKAIIYAVCDKSGSMEGSTDALQAAVSNLAASISKKEEMGVIGFSDGVEFDSGITSNPSDLSSYISQLEAGGGTNIASGTFAALNNLSGKDDSINVVIVMTDGEDSSFDDSTLANLSSICDDGHTIVYTVGLGSSVNVEYLRRIANAGNGKFVYSFSASELQALYSFIHSQMENNYTVTFTAKDTKKNNRTLTVTNTADGSVTTKDYTLGLEGEDEEEEQEDFGINGFATKKMYAKDTDIDALITGTAFEKDMSCYVTLTGESFKGSMEGSYVSETEYSVVIPAKVPPGVYQAKIVIGEGTKIDTIEILDAEPSSFTFGAYTFTAEKILIEQPDEDKPDVVVTMSGDVTMNRYLHFNGVLVLEGNPKSESMTMHDSVGSYVTFTKPQKSFFGYIVNNDQKFKELGEYVIYNDEDHKDKFDDYKVESVLQDGFALPGLTTMGSEVSMCPHMMKVKYLEFKLGLPMQDKLSSALLGFEFGTNAEAGYEAMINATGTYSKGNASIQEDNGLGSFALSEISSFTWSPTEVSISFDTYKKNYAFTLKGKLSWFNKQFALVDGVTKTIAKKDSRGDGFSFAIKEGYLDEFAIFFDHQKTIPTEIGPVTLDNFFIGMSNLKEAWQKTKKSNDWKDFFYAEAQGGCNVSLEKVSGFFADAPIAKSIFGDLALLTFENTTFKGAIKNFHLTLSSDIKLFGKFDFGKVDAKFGNFKYEDYYLGLSESDVVGLYLSTSMGPSIDLPNFKVTGQGTDMVTLNTQAFAFRRSGNINYDIRVFNDWWKWQGDYEGTFEIACRPIGGKPRLYVVFYSKDGDDKKGVRFMLTGWTPSREYF